MQKVAREEGRLSAELGAALDRHDATQTRFARTATEIRDAWTRPDSLVGGYVRSLGTVKVADTPSSLYAAVAHSRLLSQAEVAKLASDAYGLALPETMTDRLVLATPALVALLGWYPDTFKRADFGPVGDVLRDRAFTPWTDEDAPPGPGTHYRAAEPPRSDLFTITDPYTGHVYQTTRGAAMDSSRADVKKKLLNTALFTGLYAAGLHHVLGGKALRTVAALPLAAGLGHATERATRRMFAPYRNPSYMTDQGVPVSGATEFKSAALTPASWAGKLALDARYEESLGRVRRTGGERFAKWAALPVELQVATLVGRADKTYGSNASVDLGVLAENLHTLLTT
jgi:hypothetical protein